MSQRALFGVLPLVYGTLIIMFESALITMSLDLLTAIYLSEYAEVQAKVDANRPDGMVDTSDERIYGVTLEQEERIKAREAELECSSAQAELGTQDGREKRTRDIAAKRSTERRAEFQRTYMAHPDTGCTARSAASAINRRRDDALGAGESPHSTRCGGECQHPDRVPTT